MSKVFIVEGNHQYVSMFLEQGWEITNDMSEADLVQFTGGSDVSPSYYGERRHPATNNSAARDLFEKQVYTLCVNNGIPMAGICRGGQFLHVMNGGDMWQDVKGHAIYGTHPATDVGTGITVDVTSTHHQMMRWNYHGVALLVGRHNPCSIKEHMVGNEIERVECDVDVESVYYADTCCICYQPHPEFDGPEQCRNYYFNKIAELFGLE
jgi:gamma-glutamyl-gamma-aminobutyrate hydrolase PuuD